MGSKEQKTEIWQSEEDGELKKKKSAQSRSLKPISNDWHYF
jgi:hypothetical protein